MPKESVDAFGRFIAEASRHNLLSHEEELDLAQQVRAWLDTKEPSPAAIAAGKQARERLICSNLRLVVHIAKRHQRRGLEMPDLAQEGILGLHRAIEMFAPTKGYRFSTYAYHWINQAITRAIQDKSKAVRLPTHVWDVLSAARNVASEHYQKHGRYPAAQEVGKALIAKRKLKPPACHPKGVDPKDIALAKLEHYLAMNRTIGSLNYVVDQGNGDDAGEIGTLVECDGPRPDDAVTAQQQREVAQGLLRHLTPKQRAVIVARYGLDGTEAQPYAQIAAAMGMDTRNVRVMHDRAIRNLRARFEDSDFVELLRGA